MKRPLVITVLLIIGVFGLWYSFNLQPQSDIQAKGDDGGAMAQWLTLGISSVSLLTGLVGLMQKVVELKLASKKSQTVS